MPLFFHERSRFSDDDSLSSSEVCDDRRPMKTPSDEGGLQRAFTGALFSKLSKICNGSLLKIQCMCRARNITGQLIPEKSHALRASPRAVVAVKVDAAIASSRYCRSFERKGRPEDRCERGGIGVLHLDSYGDAASCKHAGRNRIARTLRRNLSTLVARRLLVAA